MHTEETRKVIPAIMTRCEIPMISGCRRTADVQKSCKLSYFKSFFNLHTHPVFNTFNISYSTMTQRFLQKTQGLFEGMSSVIDWLWGGSRNLKQWRQRSWLCERLWHADVCAKGIFYIMYSSEERPSLADICGQPQNNWKICSEIRTIRVYLSQPTINQYLQCTSVIYLQLSVNQSW